MLAQVLGRRVAVSGNLGSHVRRLAGSGRRQPLGQQEPGLFRPVSVRLGSSEQGTGMGEGGEPTSESRSAKLAAYTALKDSTVDSIMSPLISIMSDVTVYDAVEKMVSENVGCLLVLEEASGPGSAGPEIAGLITERDYLRKVAVLGRQSKETPIDTIMTPAESLVIVTPDCLVREAAQIFQENSFRHIPVMNDGGEPVGMLSTRHVTKQLLVIGHAQREYFAEYIPYDLW